MIENFPIKIDTVGRLVVPKEVRNKLNIKEGTKFYIKEEDQYIFFEKIEQITTIDYFGRVLVPKKLREKHSILSNNIVSLSTTKNGFKIKNNISKYQKLIDKLIFIDNNYDIGLLLINNTSIIYANEEYKEAINRIKEIDNYLNNKKTSFKKKEIKTSDSEILYLYIIDKIKNKKLTDLIYALI